MFRDINDFRLFSSVGLFTKSGMASLTTKYTKTPQTVITMKLFGVLQIASEQAVSIQVKEGVCLCLKSKEMEMKNLISICMCVCIFSVSIVVNFFRRSLTQHTTNYSYTSIRTIIQFVRMNHKYRFVFIFQMLHKV